MEIRPYDPERDLASTMRVFRECNWAQESEEHEEASRLLLESGTTLVATIDDEVESVASNLDGWVRHLDERLDVCVVSGVATSRVARRQKLATRLTAEALARDVIEKRPPVAALGMFEQGFYDRLGFGTSSPIPWIWFDPATVRVAAPRRVPVRLGRDDWERLHACRLARAPFHGATGLTDPAVTRHETMMHKKPFGLGFLDEQTGELTHHVWCSEQGGFFGPIVVEWMAWRTPAQFCELVAVLGSLGEQTRQIKMQEPPGIQFQDFLHKPFQRMFSAWKGEYEARTRHNAYTQVRICDLPAALAGTRLHGREGVSFRLSLTDPIADHLSPETRAKWRGVAGDFVVTLGPECSAEPDATAADLPAMGASVNTFTRLWMGVRTPSRLACSCPDLSAPPELLHRLDRILALPQPIPDWDY